VISGATKPNTLVLMLMEEGVIPVKVKEKLP